MTELNFLQRGALTRLGNIICPGGDEFPAFSDLDCLYYAHIVLDELPEQDLSDLKMLLCVLWFMPAPFMRIFLSALEKYKNMNGELGALIRMLSFGLKGITFSLYYSGLLGPNAKVKTSPVKIIGFEVHVANPIR